MSTRSRRTTGTAGVILLLMSLVLVVLGLPAAATPGGDPPGNNGTVKIDGIEFDIHPDNEPHVGCIFQVDFYGFDAGDLNAQVTFEVQPPTGPFETVLTDTVFIGEDDHSGGGSEAGIDAAATYTLDLSGYAPHPQQGWHVKLTVNAEGSIGADTKYKVFWVTGCTEVSTTSTTVDSSTTSTTVDSSTTSTTVDSSTTSTTVDSSTTSTTVDSSTTSTTAAVFDYVDYGGVFDHGDYGGVFDYRYNYVHYAGGNDHFGPVQRRRVAGDHDQFDGTVRRGVRRGGGARDSGLGSGRRPGRNSGDSPVHRHLDRFDGTTSPRLGRDWSSLLDGVPPA